MPDPIGGMRGGRCLIVQEAVVTASMKRSCHFRHTQVFRLAGTAHDLIGANTVRDQQDDLRRQGDMLVWGVAAEPAPSDGGGRQAQG